MFNAYSCSLVGLSSVLHFYHAFAVYPRRRYVFGLFVRLCVRASPGGSTLRPAFQSMLFFVCEIQIYYTLGDRDVSSFHIYAS